MNLCNECQQLPKCDCCGKPIKSQSGLSSLNIASLEYNKAFENYLKENPSLKNLQYRFDLQQGNNISFEDFALPMAC